MLIWEFTIYSLVKKLGIPRDTLNGWRIKGYIKPSRYTEDSRGKKSFFNFWEVTCIIFFKKLTKEQKFPGKLAAEIVDSIRHFNITSPTDEYKENEYLIVTRKKDGKMDAKFCTGRQTIDLSKIRPTEEFCNMFVWDFKDIIKEARMVI